MTYENYRQTPGHPPGCPCKECKAMTEKPPTECLDGHDFQEFQRCRRCGAPKPAQEPIAEPKLLRVAPRACEIHKPSYERWNVIQRIDTGLIVGNIGPGKNGVSFAPDGVAYLLSATALREIADLIDLHGLELAT